MSAPASFVADAAPASFQPDTPPAPAAQPQGMPSEVAARHARATPQGANFGDPNAPLSFKEAGFQLAKGATEFMRDIFDPRVPVVDGHNSLWSKYVSGPLEAQGKQAAQTTGLESAGHTLASFVPFVGPLAAETGEQLSKTRLAQVKGQSMGDTVSEYAAAGLLGASALLGARGAGEAENTATAPFEKDLVTSKAHAVLEHSAASAKTELGRAASNVGTRIGEHVQGISDADTSVSSSNQQLGSISAGKIMNPLVKATGQKSVTYKTMPNVAKAFDILGEMPNPMSWEQAKMYRTEINSLIGKASPREQSILQSAHEALNTELANRARDLDAGQGTLFQDSHKAYEQLHQKMSDYKDGILGKLMGASTGLDFFKEINKPSNRPALTALNKDLSEFGLADNFFEDLKKSHKDTYFLAKQSESGSGGFIGRIGGVMRHPVAVGVPAAVPLFLPIHGSFILSMITAAKAADLADRVAATAEMRRLQVPTKVEGRFGSASTAPVP